MKFAIDLGHGIGQDRGAEGIITEESIINSVGNLVIAKLRALGHNVIEVRPSNASNVSDSLIQRVDNANINNVDLYVSIHANAGGGSFFCFL
jgi:N-acetylmuramoyl-L-alanine amidase